MSEHDVVVIGAGPAGIATAISLQARGVRPLVVDRASEVASSWRARYDRLKLNTGRQFSHMPGRRYPTGTPNFPTRDQVVGYFDQHARESGIRLQLDTAVKQIDPKGGGGWRLATSMGEIEGRHVVVATGLMHTPFTPEWAHGGFPGLMLHSSQYRNPGRYAGKRVLVVGSGSSGMEIAHDLSTGGAATVWLAVRTPPNIMLRGGPAGLPGDVIALPLYHAPIRLADAFARAARRRSIGDLSEFGLPMPDEGPFGRLARLGAVPTLVDLEVIDAVRDGSIDVVATVDTVDGTGEVRLVDGRCLQPDAVICATGYRAGLDSLVGHLGVLDDCGVPRVSGDRPAAPGLWFIGFSSRPALIGYVCRQSRRLARRIAAA